MTLQEWMLIVGVACLIAWLVIWVPSWGDDDDYDEDDLAEIEWDSDKEDTCLDHPHDTSNEDCGTDTY